jgi:fatty acid desaturase
MSVITVVQLDSAVEPSRSAPRGHARPIDKAWLRVNPWVMVRRLAVFALLLGTGYAAILSRHLLGSVVGTLVVGAMYAHGVELTHQFLHGTGFRNRAANRMFGFLCALPMFVSHSHYRALHLAHHRNLGTPANFEFFNYGDVKGKPLLVVLARSFSPARYVGVGRNLLRALTGKPAPGATTPAERRAIQIEYLAMLATLVAAIVFTIATRSDLAIRLWVIPVLLVSEPVHFWVELPEHFGCDLTTRNVLHNTRTIRGSWLSFWFTNGNNFHVEHHLYPRVAIDQLPHVHPTLRGDLRHFNSSYASFLRTVITRETEPAAETDPAELAMNVPPLEVEADHSREDQPATQPALHASPGRRLGHSAELAAVRPSQATQDPA